MKKQCGIVQHVQHSKLSADSFKCHVSAHCTMLSRAACNRVTSAISVISVAYILESSVKETIVIPYCSNILASSLMYSEE